MDSDEPALKGSKPRAKELMNRARLEASELRAAVDWGSIELGYFMGALGRSGVAALCSTEIERPSDIHGGLYIDGSSDDWELRLAQEMRDAALPVVLNRL